MRRYRLLAASLLLWPLLAQAGDIVVSVPVESGAAPAVVVPVAPGSRGRSQAPQASAGIGSRVFSSFHRGLNSMSSRGEVSDAAGFVPDREAGQLLSDAHKMTTRVVRVRPDAGPFKTAVVKTASADKIRRELFARRVLKSYPGFQGVLEAADGVGYRTGLFWQKGVLLLEDRPAKHALVLTAKQSAALAVLLYGLGVDDLNSDGVRLGDDGRILLHDFEGALTPLRPDMGPNSLTFPMSHVSDRRVNKMQDYLPQIDAWKQWLASPAARTQLMADLRASGFSEREARQALETMDSNAALMPDLIAKDVQYANQHQR